MAWLGEQFSTLTGRLTEFTKDVLNEHTDSTKEMEHQKDINLPHLNHEKFFQMLNEKDAKIKELLTEKENFESSIEELDEQHQEAVNELLSLKGNLVKENKKLKKQAEILKKELEAEVSKSCLLAEVSKNLNFDAVCSDKHAFQDNSDYDNDNHKILVHSTISDEEEKYLNQNFKFISLLCTLKDIQSNDTILKESISHLENEKLQIESLKIENITPEQESLRQSLDRIDGYISFLKCVNNYPQQLLSTTTEISVIIRTLSSENAILKQNIMFLRNENKKLKMLQEISGEKNIPVKEYSSDNNDSLEIACSEYNMHKIFSKAKNISHEEKEDTICTKYSQTDNWENSSQHNKCNNCIYYQELNRNLEIEIDIFKCKILTLEQETQGLHDELSDTSEVKDKKFQSVEIQTSCDIISTDALKYKNKLEEFQRTLRDKEAYFNAQLVNQTQKIFELEEELKLQRNIIHEKNEKLSAQHKEILALRSTVDKLKSELNSVSATQSSSTLKSIKDVYNKCGNVESNKTHDKNAEQNGKEREECNKIDNSFMSVIEKSNKQFFPSTLNKEIILLQEKLKNAELEKGQMLCVLNEKSKECSSLKSEVHLLTNIVASEKQALLKLQQDNHDLKRIQKDSLDQELTKETVQNLSRLIRDKDLEIDALKQKNASLATIIQQSGSNTEHIQSLLEERENLVKQLNMYKSDKDQIAEALKSKSQECLYYHSEVQRLSSVLACQSEKFDVLQQQHQSVAIQYEEKQKSLINTQNEMIALKQRVTDLEQQQIDIKEKYNQLLNKINSDIMIQITRDEFNSKLNEIENLKIIGKDKDNLIYEKDCMIHELSQNIQKCKVSEEEKDNEVSDLKKQIEDVFSKLSEAEGSITKLQEEKERLEQRLNDKNAELGLLKEINERLNMTMKEKEFEVKSMEEKISSLSQLIKGTFSSSENADIEQILTESKVMYDKAQHFHRERDETLLALSQSQQENQGLKNELQKQKDKEDHLKNELDRLRRHLLQIEENYTNEALKAEEREKELRNHLAEIENKARVTNTAVLDASHQANIQVASLQEQVVLVANQRDRALAQVSVLDDKVQQYAASLSNLQLVLEQIQKGNEQKIQNMDSVMKKQLLEERQRSKHLEVELEKKKIQLEESLQALEAASRLSEQLDSKEEVIFLLKTELAKTETVVQKTTEEIKSIKSNTEGKVDRQVMKSLVLGYFSTPPGQKSEVVRLLARVLDFNQEEMEKAGIRVGRNSGGERKGIFSSWFQHLSFPSPTRQPQNSQETSQQSFTSLFVQFLENESQPLTPMPLPAEKMARELTSKTVHSHQARTTANGHLLMNIGSTFPTFAPVPIADINSPAPSILKEVLK